MRMTSKMSIINVLVRHLYGISLAKPNRSSGTRRKVNIKGLNVTKHVWILNFIFTGNSDNATITDKQNNCIRKTLE